MHSGNELTQSLKYSLKLLFCQKLKKKLTSFFFLQKIINIEILNPHATAKVNQPIFFTKPLKSSKFVWLKKIMIEKLLRRKNLIPSSITQIDQWWNKFNSQENN